MVKVASRELIPMKLSFLKQGVALLLSVFPIFPIILQPALAWENRGGYWKEGYWCSPENNYCRETWGNRYNGGWGNQNYYQPLESIEYNGVIIVHQQVPPRTDVCPWVVNRGLPCDGYQGFNASTRTHIFRNNGNWNNNGGCLFKKWTRDGGFAIGNC